MKKLFLLAAAVALLSAGCAAHKMYAGPRLEPRALSVLDSMPAGELVKFTKGMMYAFDPGGRVNIVSLDEKKAGYSKHIEFKPGYHMVKLYFSRSGRNCYLQLAFNAEAGKTYKAAAVETIGRMAVFWIEEADTRTVVSGRRPRQFDPK